MFPDVDAQDGYLTGQVGAVWIGRADDLELAAGQHQPGPAAAETVESRLLQLLLKRCKIAGKLVDFIGKRPARFAAGPRAHEGPEHRVIGVPPAVVDHGLPDVL